MAPIDSLEPRRLFAAGAIDTTFGGGDGRVDVAIDAHADWRPSATGAAVDGAGRAIVAGVFGGRKNRVGVARLTADGRADASFGDGGIASVALPLNRSGDVRLAADGRGRVLVLLSTPAGVTLTRLTDAGAPDPKFGRRGTAVVPGLTSAADLAVADASTNGVLVAGLTPGRSGTRGAIVRLTYRGRLDAAFAGGAGVYKTPVPGAADVGFGAAQPPDPSDPLHEETRVEGYVDGLRFAVLPDGRIAAVAGIHVELTEFSGGLSDYVGESGFWTFRLGADGALDRTYGDAGRVVRTASYDSQGDANHSLALDAIAPDGGVVLQSSQVFVGREILDDRYYTSWLAVDADGHETFYGDAAPDLPDGEDGEGTTPAGQLPETGIDRWDARVRAVLPDGRWLATGRQMLRRVEPGLIPEDSDAGSPAAVDGSFAPSPAGDLTIVAGDRAFSIDGPPYDGGAYGARVRVTAIRLR